MPETTNSEDFSLFFSLLPRKTGLETGSHTTASATTHSFQTRELCEATQTRVIGDPAFWDPIL